MTKIKITIFVTVTTMFGFICAAGEINSKIIAPTIGILLLACGSAVLNHLQERKTDALMDRTKNRPLPTGRITPNGALTIALVLVALGSIIMIFGTGLLAWGLGMLNLFWYNGVYTPMKKRNPLAIIPGSLVGAIPPVVGWVAAGGSLLDPRIAILAFFFFIWQIPHFWLLLLIFSNDYIKAGFPTLTQIFSHDQLARITFVWIVATVVTCMLIPLFGIGQSFVIDLGLLAAGAWLTIKTFSLLRSDMEKKYFSFAFRGINLFAILVVILLSLDKLVI